MNEPLEAVGVIIRYLMRYGKTLFFCFADRDESVSSLCTILVIISLASSARMAIACDWPYLSLTAALVATRGGSLTNTFYLPLLWRLWSLYVCSYIRIFCVCVCVFACASVCVCMGVRALPRGKKDIKLSNQGATDRAFGTTEEPNGCVGCGVAEPSWNGVQLSAGQANLCPHSIRRHTLTV